MELNTRTQDISVRETAYAGGAEQAVDSDITLPEYFPDIVRVLKCELKPNIASVKAAGDRITADGAGVLSVLYLSDDRKMHCFEQNIPFTKFVETKAAEARRRRLCTGENGVCQLPCGQSPQSGYPRQYLSAFRSRHSQNAENFVCLRRCGRGNEKPQNQSLQSVKL